MTPSFDPSQPGSGDGCFRPGEHILAVPQASALAILDLERGVMYATTPLGADSWRRLVSDERPARRTVAETRSGPEDDEDHEDRHVWARIAGYLLDRRIIEPVAD